MIRFFGLFTFLFILNANAQELVSPLQKNNFEKATSYIELSDFVQQLDQQSDLLKVEIIGKSVQNRNFYDYLCVTQCNCNNLTRIKTEILYILFE